jgi:hypothetical protein
MAKHQSYSQVNYPILPPPHVASGREWANGALAGALAHINGVEKRTVIRTEDVFCVFDPVASGFDPAKDTVVLPPKIDPALTTGEIGSVPPPPPPPPSPTTTAPPPGFGAEAEFLSSAEADYISVAALSGTQFVVAYQKTSNGRGAAMVGTVSGTSVTFGAEAEFLSSAEAGYISVAALSGSRFVVAYEDGADSDHGTAKVGTVSGTGITFGAEAEFLSADGARDISVAALDAGRFVVAYQDGSDSGHGTAKVGMVSGSAVAFGAEAEFLSADGAFFNSVAALDAGRFVVAYSDGSDSSHGKAKVGTVSGTAIAFGAEAEFLAGLAYLTFAAALGPGKFVVVYQDDVDSSQGKAKVGTVSGTDITFGAEAEFLSTYQAYYISVAALSGTQFVVAYRDGSDSNHGTAKVGTVSGTAIAFGAEAEFLSADGAYYVSAAALGAGKFAVAYKDAADSGHGTVKIGSVLPPPTTTAPPTTSPPITTTTTTAPPPGFGAEAEFLSAGQADYVSAAALSGAQFVVAYRDDPGSNHGTAKVGTVSGTGITFGAEAEFLSADGVDAPSVAALGAGEFVVAYRDDADGGHGTARVGTVSGTGIAFGAEAEFLSANGAFDVSAAALSATQFVVAYMDGADSGHGTAKVGTVSGTAIAFGAEAEFLPADGAGSISVAALGAARFVVAYRDESDSGHGKAKVGTVSGDAIAFGAEAEFLPADGVRCNSAAALGADKFVVAWRDDSDSGHGTAKVWG